MMFIVGLVGKEVSLTDNLFECWSWKDCSWRSEVFACWESCFLVKRRGEAILYTSQQWDGDHWFRNCSCRKLLRLFSMSLLFYPYDLLEQVTSLLSRSGSWLNAASYCFPSSEHKNAPAAKSEYNLTRRRPHRDKISGISRLPYPILHYLFSKTINWRLFLLMS